MVASVKLDVVSQLWSFKVIAVAILDGTFTLFQVGGLHAQMGSSESTLRWDIEIGEQRLRQLRHPCIVNYVGSSMRAHELSLLTERVEMLDLKIDSQFPIEVHTGLTHILSALVFLHEKVTTLLLIGTS
ncbi:unnamed protein product [Toxocara canis]|uniref:Protein kinase domain-containing protein n=1 Tax=Toxocara canis TaxID=6265 RepID=A0A183UFY8_TOXCA|nr:unnamed protein product [Toxocara canis]